MHATAKVAPIEGGTSASVQQRGNKSMQYRYSIVKKQRKPIRLTVAMLMFACILPPAQAQNDRNPGVTQENCASAARTAARDTRCAPTDDARALFNKGMALEKQGQPDAAIAVYDEIDRRFDEDESPAVRQWVAKALVNKGRVLEEQGKFDAALAVVDGIE
ncbi:MAG: tetratricopeptide repeat protein, partial [Azoarcus sp.]|nr:tetratricopeptide repeat protein [Azoarcus sp.]